MCLNIAVMSQDCQEITFRTIGSIGKRNRRMIQHSRDGSYNLPPTRPSQIETKYYDGSNVDSGLGESTPQEFSSCCSSSADSAKPTRVPQMQLGGEVRYELSSNQEIYPPVDSTLDAVLQPIISTLTRRQRNCPK
ncbi:hypothetical protein WN51_14182 [Melipona quadrifasciata]|uniref:Uncharacterized protein n=1 Tax=Melipona quadrifasciata TaxID=166423 RepID=A0A0N0U5D2_9HYME|nr:hypothetical protein WN51_14182 [Melipona quadrifasciata]